MSNSSAYVDAIRTLGIPTVFMIFAMYAGYMWLDVQLEEQRVEFARQMEITGYRCVGTVTRDTSKGRAVFALDIVLSEVH